MVLYIWSLILVNSFLDQYTRSLSKEEEGDDSTEAYWKALQKSSRFQKKNPATRMRILMDKAYFHVSFFRSLRCPSKFLKLCLLGKRSNHPRTVHWKRFCPWMYRTAHIACITSRVGREKNNSGTPIGHVYLASVHHHKQKSTLRHHGIAATFPSARFTRTPRFYVCILRF